MGKRPQGPTQSISNFMLDARGAPQQSKETEKAEAEAREDEDAEVAALMRETRIWRLANSAQWVAWGIVQAKVGGMPDFSPQTSGTITPTANDAAESKADDDTAGAVAAAAHNAIVSPEAGTDPLDQEAQGLREDVLAKRPDEREEGDEAEAEDSEFDYLAYARSRAMFFWGDALELGIVEEKDLPEDVLRNVCRVEY